MSSALARRTVLTLTALAMVGYLAYVTARAGYLNSAYVPTLAGLSLVTGLAAPARYRKRRRGGIWRWPSSPTALPAVRVTLAIAALMAVAGFVAVDAIPVTTYHEHGSYALYAGSRGVECDGMSCTVWRQEDHVGKTGGPVRGWHAVSRATDVCALVVSMNVKMAGEQG